MRGCGPGGAYVRAGVLFSGLSERRGRSRGVLEPFARRAARIRDRGLARCVRAKFGEAAIGLGPGRAGGAGGVVHEARILLAPVHHRVGRAAGGAGVGISCRRRGLAAAGVRACGRCFRTRWGRLNRMGKTTAVACRGRSGRANSVKETQDGAPTKVVSRASAHQPSSGWEMPSRCRISGTRSQAKGVVPSAGPPPMASRRCPSALVASIPTRRGSLRTARVSKPIQMASPSGDGTVSPSAPEQNGKEPRLVGAA